MFSSRNVIFQRFVFSFILLATVFIVSQSVAASTIAGLIYDNRRNPLPLVDVELLNEYYQLRGRTTTDGVGRYQFTGLPDGFYTVRVLPFRYDLEDQEQLVEINTLSIRGAGVGNTYITRDFSLIPKKGGLAETTTGVVFAQDVPKTAEKLYKQANEDFADGKESEGVAKLIEAIKTFPEYYYALHRLGVALFVRKQYLDATNAFMRAVNVNPKSSISFYYMGTALNSLGKDYNKAAIVALTKASALAPASPQVAYMLGKVEREQGNFEAAEKHLVRAKKLADEKVAEIHKELAQLYANDLKQYGKAADELESYMKATKLKDDAVKEKIADLRRKAKEGT